MIPISRPCLGQEEKDAVLGVLDSGMLRFGKLGARFEKAFLEVEGGSGAVAVSSGTAALHTALSALVEPGDEVLVPSFTFVATASMVLAVEAKPVFCDVDPETFLITEEEMRSKVTDRTKAVIPVHLYGNPVPLDGTLALARELGLKVIWDAAQSQGSVSCGKRLGEAPDAVCYSFYPTKNMTVGEGGMVVVDDPELESVVRALSDHGREAKYSHGSLGFNYRMTDLEAAIGLAQLAKVEGHVARRREIAAAYIETLAGIPGVTPMRIAEDGLPSYNQFTIRLEDYRFQGKRDLFVENLREKGIGCDIHYPLPLHLQPMFKGYATSPLPVSEDLATRVLSLPIHPLVTDEDIETVLDGVKQTAEALGGS